MKPLPIFIVLNLLVGILVVFLFIGQRDLDTRLASLEASASAAPEPAANVAPEPAASTREGTEAIARFGARLLDPEPDPSLGMTQAEMDLLRKRLRRANELNSEEDEFLRVAHAVNRLVEDERIASLSPEQEARVVEALVVANRELPQISRRVAERHDISQMSSEERREARLSEYDRLRSEVQKALESIVPQADARVIVDDRYRDPKRRTKSR